MIKNNIELNEDNILLIKENLKSKLLQERVILFSEKFSKLKLNAQKSKIYSQKNYYESIAGDYIRIFPSLKDFIACYNNNLDHPPICPYCGDYCSIRKGEFPYRYNHSCGKKECDEKRAKDLAKTTIASSESLKKSRETIKLRYGVSNISQLDFIKEKKKQTCQEHYGVNAPFQSSIVINKYKENSLSKYGVEWPNQSEEIKEKSKKTNLEKYGYVASAQAPEVKQKLIKNNILKYGHSCPLQNHEIKSKAQAKYKFEGIIFDSSWELIFYFYIKKIRKLKIERITNPILYYDNGNILHRYYPDFKIENNLIEIKGPHLLLKDENNNIIGLTSPFLKKKSEEEKSRLSSLLSAKYTCMLENNIHILEIKEINFYKKIIEKEYGKDFLKNLIKTSKKYQ